MNSIVLVCSFGLSTSLLVNSMETAAKEAGVQAQIRAIGSNEVQDHVEEADVFLIAPQVRYLMNSIAAHGRPAGVIEGRTYALADGAGALRQALALMEQGV
ncbi:PTS sugar transporter subunit IIB [Tumebacillus sp. ITR2]|uniref:PTS sugar transporter subunit IIB n=1 Tax=Tumebacillus amylolyticus TaxID=2801339 RepID=A0ABS1JAN0_9BACL|nr:PTS sugar transporter subunit IIB [Tumebacillus amylolyticus]MBL0387339.1 PTS sugar transporter subunit IIB [Tumebacillus amylolyticus]